MGAGFIALLVLAGPRQEAAAPAPPRVQNLVVVTIDTVRADHLGCYGYFRDTTPELDALAAESLRFTNCRTPIAQTTPSHASIMTGVGPLEHGVLSNHDPDPAHMHLSTNATLRTLAQAFSARGFRTGGFVGAAPVKRATGLAEGFAEWREPAESRRSGAEVVRDALDFLDRSRGARRFVWAHLYDAHEPLKPPSLPDSYATRYGADDPEQARWLAARGFPAEQPDLVKRGISIAEENARYDGALRYLDDQLAPLLARLRSPPLRDTTALVVVADHGTANGQHGHMGHGICWDEELRVPLLIRVPGVAPRVIETPLATTDLWPTLFALAPALADEEFRAQCRGANVLAGEYEPRPIFALAARGPKLMTLTAGHWKLIRRPNGGRRLFDLAADPNELTDVVAQHAEVADRLGRLLDAEVAREKRAHQLHGLTAASGAVDPKLLEQLRALGYVGGSAAPAGDGRDR
jgi:choline-sulfatase